MSELSALNDAIRNLNKLYSVCTDDKQCEQILEMRDKLDAQATELANKTLREGSQELNDATAALNALTIKVTEATNEIKKIADAFKKTAEVIGQAADAIGKVAKLIAVL